MESYYIIMIAILALLAMTDLVVGVSNDAVNFLNSAIGSKAFSLRNILIIASLGVLMGSVSSSGMMEVARKSIFSPAMYDFDEIMILFLAVMLTDVLLLDLYNTLRLPTSTTVSIVFELLGASVALALIKINSEDKYILEQMGEFINTAKAMLIIAGILLSVVVAFSIGAIVQYISRLIFTFQFKKKIPYFGALFAGLAITAISYFIFIKGLKGTGFYKEIKHVLEDSLGLVLLGSFVFWVIICQLLHSVFKVNILKIVIVIGTFSLAMAFAGNDLVNFIGVPIAAYQSFEAWVASGIADPSAFSMEGLAGKVPTPTIFLFVAGGIMVVTLWFSKKARAVTETEVNLARQGNASERFQPNALSRGVVRVSMGMSNAMQKVLPGTVLANIENRFQSPKVRLTKKEQIEAPAFDLIRASVNLMVAGILISIGTSLKLPLSTTYVTFMVGMGTSLADRAWDRESAVYRIAGVFHVIGGWFMTAIIAFSASAVMAYIIHLGGRFGGTPGTTVVVVLLTLIALGILGYGMFFTKAKTESTEFEDLNAATEDKGVFVAKATRNIVSVLKHISDIYERTISGFDKEDLVMLKKVAKKTKDIDERSKSLRDNVHGIIYDLNAISLEAGNHYVQVASYLREIGHSMSFIVNPMKTYIANNHKPFKSEQIEELKELSELIKELYEDVKVVAGHTPEEFSEAEAEVIRERRKRITDYIEVLRRKQVKRIKSNDVGTRNSILYLSVLNETKTLMLHTGNVIKSLRDFSEATKESAK